MIRQFNYIANVCDGAILCGIFCELNPVLIIYPDG